MTMKKTTKKTMKKTALRPARETEIYGDGDRGGKAFVVFVDPSNIGNVPS